MVLNEPHQHFATKEQRCCMLWFCLFLLLFVLIASPGQPVAEPEIQSLIKPDHPGEVYNYRRTLDHFGMPMLGIRSPSLIGSRESTALFVVLPQRSKAIDGRWATT